MREYYVYLLASRSRRLYVGVTNDLQLRLAQHRRSGVGFTKQYRITALVYFEQTTDVMSAITREKQLKRWPRWRKVRLIEASNSGWLDLGAGWTETAPPDTRQGK